MGVQHCPNPTDIRPPNIQQLLSQYSLMIINSASGVHIHFFYKNCIQITFFTFKVIITIF